MLSLYENAILWHVALGYHIPRSGGVGGDVYVVCSERGGGWVVVVVVITAVVIVAVVIVYLFIVFTSGYCVNFFKINYPLNQLSQVSP